MYISLDDVYLNLRGAACGGCSDCCDVPQAYTRHAQHTGMCYALFPYTFLACSVRISNKTKSIFNCCPRYRLKEVQYLYNLGQLYTGTALY